MREEYVAIGKNVDNAIDNGLLYLGKSREDVDIKIVETGGLFKKAKVVLSYEKEEIIETLPENKKIEVRENKEIIEDASNELMVNKDINSNDNVELVIENNESNKEEIITAKKSPAPIDCTNLKSKVNEFLTNLLLKANINATVTCEEGLNELHFAINGENVGKLIGYRGETLNAIQYLLGMLKESGEGKIRVYLDVEGYKAKREETLVELANKMADKAEEIERNVHLDPMTPYERRIIHTALQERALVETESTGEGDKRHVVIKFKR